jgi:hypothetical protein
MKCPKEVRMINIEEMEKKRFLFGMRKYFVFSCSWVSLWVMNVSLQKKGFSGYSLTSI